MLATERFPLQVTGFVVSRTSAEAFKRRKEISPISNPNSYVYNKSFS